MFDLDGTITRRDTYLAYLLGFLGRHPERWSRVLSTVWFFRASPRKYELSRRSWSTTVMVPCLAKSLSGC